MRAPSPSGGMEVGVALFPHRMDVVRQRMTFIPVDRKSLRVCSFLDGREAFWNGDPVDLPFGDIGIDPETADSPSRYIFHVGFCGSTLLSRLLDTVDRTLVLREPRILTDLAEYQAVLDRAGQHDPRVDDAILRADALLHRRWRPDEAIVLKPSNWINNLVPRLCERPSAIRPLFLTIDRRSYLRAIWRGGSARIAFAARAAVHFSGGGEVWSRCVANVLQQSDDEADKLALLAALSHRFQEELLLAGWQKCGGTADRWMSFAEIRADPAAAAAKAAEILCLPLAHRSSIWWGGVHSKRPGEIFDEERESAANRSLEATHGKMFDKALDRLDQIFPPRAPLANRP